MAGEQSRAVKTFSCPSCAAPQTIRGLGQTTTYACQSCGSVIDISDENYRILQAYQRKQLRRPLIELGARGSLFDTTYEVIGFMVRTDQFGAYPWEEYLLFNPYKGFAWLVQYQGHWNYVFSIKGRPTPSSNRKWAAVKYDGQSFRLFLTGKAKVHFVLGEFYWQVKVGDIVDVEDYIAPPYILSLEKDDSEQVWSLGTYVPRVDIAKAFNIQEADLPWPEGIMANQPGPFSHNQKNVVFAAVLFLILASLIHIIFALDAKNQIVYEANHYYEGDPISGQNAIIGEPFDLEGRTGNLMIQYFAPVVNNWIDFDLDLVNSQTGEAIESNAEVSYYSGYDSDGAWTEGSQKQQVFLPAVPTGKYYLSFSFTPGANLPPMSYSVRVTSAASYHGNYIFVLILIGLWPAIVLIRRAFFEGQRWQNSDLGDSD